MGNYVDWGVIRKKSKNSMLFRYYSNKLRSDRFKYNELFEAVKKNTKFWILYIFKKTVQ